APLPWLRTVQVTVAIPPGSPDTAADETAVTVRSILELPPCDSYAPRSTKAGEPVPPFDTPGLSKRTAPTISSAGAPVPVPASIAAEIDRSRNCRPLALT